ncbi:T9SS type A sorting domain-containing protein [Flavobacterium lacustre]|uniref:Ig-like domain-containing protein n=1 Tax=Flavobacterium lacustre TaxID=3016339 RepID=UPI0022B65344|nr:T9SS type A sorting domain-containing protein [Flavobacterium lacustre]
MKNTILSLLLCFFGLLAKDLQAQVLSVASGSGFNIKSGTVVSAAGLDLTPSADFSLKASLSGGTTVSNTTTIPSIKRSYQFSCTTASFNGALKINYQDTELNGLTESSLKLLYNNGSAWTIDNSSTNNATDNFVLTSLSTKTLNELSLGYCMVPNAPTVSGVAVCKGTSATLNTSSQGTINWYNASTGGSLLYTGSTYVTPPLSSSTTYYVSATTCATSIKRTEVKVTVSTPALATTISGAGTLCSGNTKVLTLTKGYVGAIKWQISTDGIAFTDVTPAVSTASYSIPKTLPAAKSYSFRVVMTSGACSATTKPVVISIAPAAVTGTIAASNTVCSGSATKLVLTGNVGTIQWQLATTATGTYSNISGATAATYTTPLLTTSVFYRAMVTSNGCSSATAGFGITVQKAVAGTVAGVPTSSVCLTTPPTLSLKGSSGSVFQWQSATTSTGTYTAITGGTSSTYVANNSKVAETRYYRVAVSYPNCSTVFTPTVKVTFKTCSSNSKEVEEIPSGTRFSVMAYPNPFTSNFKLGVTTSSIGKVNVSVYDMIGRLVEQRKTDISEIANQEMGNNYPSGVYNIIVTQDADSKTLRVIKR